MFSFHRFLASFAVACTAMFASANAFAQHYYSGPSGHMHTHPHGSHHHHGVGIEDGRFGGAMPYPGMASQNFGSLGHIDELAANVRYLANHITFDMYYNYQFNPGFHQIYAKCYAFRNLSYRIHDMEHAGQLVEMTAAIHEMDSLFHSLEHDVAGWRRLHRIQIGQGDLRTKMEMLEEMMHHLMHDAGVRSQFLIDNGAAPAAPVSTGAPAATVVPQTQVVPQFQRVEQQVVPQPQRLPSPTSQLPFLPGQG